MLWAIQMSLWLAAVGFDGCEVDTQRRSFCGLCVGLAEIYMARLLQWIVLVAFG